MLENKKCFQNEKAKKMLYKNILEYSKMILNQLDSNKDLLPTILNSLEMTEEDFWKKISLENIDNTVFYDQVLDLLNKNL